MKITKKLRDVTEEEFREWKDTNCCKSSLKCSECPFDKVNCETGNVRSWVLNKDMYSDKFLNQTIEVEVPDILNKEEKEYLSAVIKPFRNKVKNIIKFSCAMYDDYEYIGIITKEINTYLPMFKKNTMYKNMELGKKYTLKELGL